MRTASTNSNVRRNRSTHQRNRSLRIAAPVVDRIAPVLAGGAPVVGWHSGHLAALEELGMAARIGTVRGDVEGDVAEDADALCVGVVAHGSPLPGEAHLIGDRVATGVRRPVADPEGWSRTNASISSADTRACGLASSDGEPANADGLE